MFSSKTFVMAVAIFACVSMASANVLTDIFEYEDTRVLVRTAKEPTGFGICKGILGTDCTHGMAKNKHGYWANILMPTWFWQNFEPYSISFAGAKTGDDYKQMQGTIKYKYHDGRFIKLDNSLTNFRDEKIVYPVKVAVDAEGMDCFIDTACEREHRRQTAFPGETLYCLLNDYRQLTLKMRPFKA
eukprot:Nk52_evm44s24 gene=Nk52_evmTU44s24